MTPQDDCEADGDGTVFRAWIEHNNSDDYFYIISPVRDHSDYLGTNPVVDIEDLENNASTQAVRKMGADNNVVAGMVFYPGAIPDFVEVEASVPGQSLSFKTDAPCALLYDEREHQVCISSPDRQHNEILLTINNSNNQESDITVTLPRGQEAGRSECIRFSDFVANQTCNTNNIEVEFTSIMSDLTGGGDLNHSWTITGGQFLNFSFGPGDPNPTLLFGNSTSNNTYTVTHTIELNGLPITSVQKLSFHQINPGITISGTVTIDPAYNGGDPVMVIAGNLVIEDNAHVTISDDMTIMFCGTDAELVVEKGGYLSLGGTVTDFNNQTWKGIRVMGDATLSQAWPNFLDQGRLSVRANTVIQNAQTAILVGNSVASRGGIISCHKAQFLNNKQGIVYSGTYNFNNFGLVRQCDFVVDDAYPHAEPFQDFIYLFGINNFNVEGSNFRNNIETPNVASEIEYGVGIRAFDSGFIVRGTPSQGVIPSTFTNLGYGISVHSSLSPNSRIHYLVRNSEFNYCFVGIRNAGIIASTIRSNRFNMGAVPPNDIEVPNVSDLVQSGIVYEGALQGILCEENEFLGNYSGPNEIISVGIFCDNTLEFNNEIRRNTFERMTAGNLAARTNGTGDEFDPRGLVYFCNSNRELNKNSFWLEGIQEEARGYDISVPGDDNTQSTIRSIQGIPAIDPDDNIPAGNTFSYPVFTNPSNNSGVYNKSSNPDISYWYYLQAPDEFPTTNSGVNVVDYDNETTCGDVVEPPCCDPAGPKLDFFQNEDDYEALKAIIGNNNPTVAQVNELAFYQAEMDRATATVVRFTMNDTLNFNTDSLYTWVGNMNSIGAELWLAREYLSNGDGTTALAILDSIPANYNLSTDQATDISNYRAVTDLIKTDMELGPGPVQTDTMSLSENTRNALKNYVDAGGQTEIWAKNILTFYGAHFSPEYLFAVESREERNDEVKMEESSLSNITVSPNPAKNFVNFRIDKSHQGHTRNLEIIDLNGRILQAYSNITEAQTITWNTQGLASGIYFYRLLSNNGKVESGKIILSK